MENHALFLCPSEFDKGTYHRALAFGRSFRQKGLAEVDLICTARQTFEEKIQGVHVIGTSEWGPKMAPLAGWNLGEVLGRFQKIFKRKKRYSLIYSFEYQPNVSWVAFSLAKAWGVPHFNDWCDWYAGRHQLMKGIKWLQTLDAKFEEFPRKRADCVTTICTELYDRAIQCGVEKKNLLLIREGAEFANQKTSKNEARKKLNLDDSLFLAVCMTDREKDLIRDSAKALHRKNPQSKLAFIGDQRSTGYADDFVFTPGRVSDNELDLWLSAADCAWLPLEDLPLNRGRLPHKIGHYRSYGLPLVTNAVGDIPLLNDSGIHFAEFSLPSFVEKTAQLKPLNETDRQRELKTSRPIYEWNGLLGPLMERAQSAFQVASTRRNR